MTFIEVHTNGKLKYRWPIAIESKKGVWQESVVEREMLVNFFIDILRKHVMPIIGNEAEYFIVFESKLHLYATIPEDSEPNECPPEQENAGGQKEPVREET